MKFKLWEPADLSETVQILDEMPNAEPMAGGTDLLVRIKRGLNHRENMVSLQRISSLRNIVVKPGQFLKIGALVTHAQAASEPIVAKKFTALAQACTSVGSPQIRNLGTLAGNLANASPAADTAPALLALNAVLVIYGTQGRREVGLDKFFKGPGTTVLKKGEIIEEIFLPWPEEGTSSIYQKLGRRKALEIAICGAALAGTGEKDAWHHSRLALGAVAPIPYIDRIAGEQLNSFGWSFSVAEDIAEGVSLRCSPIDDQRASADYRKRMVKVLVKKCMAELKGGDTKWLEI